MTSRREVTKMVMVFMRSSRNDRYGGFHEWSTQIAGKSDLESDLEMNDLGLALFYETPLCARICPGISAGFS